MNSKNNHSKFTYKFYPRHSQTSLFNLNLLPKNNDTQLINDE